jgi:hypothetical protein
MIFSLFLQESDHILYLLNSIIMDLHTLFLVSYKISLLPFKWFKSLGERLYEALPLIYDWGHLSLEEIDPCI